VTLKIGALGSGGGLVLAGGRSCSIACWNGSSHGRLQNYEYKEMVKFCRGIATYI